MDAGHPNTFLGFCTYYHIFLLKIRTGIFSPQKGKALLPSKAYGRFSFVRHDHLDRRS